VRKLLIVFASLVVFSSQLFARKGDWDVFHHRKVIYVADRPLGKVHSLTPSSFVGSD
jgi:hypothetical protein